MVLPNCPLPENNHATSGGEIITKPLVPPAVTLPLSKKRLGKSGDTVTDPNIVASCKLMGVFKGAVEDVEEVFYTESREEKFEQRTIRNKPQESRDVHKSLT